MSSELSPDEILRYSRHLIIPEVGLEGQRKLKEASVLIVGTGGLGSPIALYLAAAGIGRIGIVDFDVVDTSNLQRQIIHSSHSQGQPKVESARQRMTGINPFIQVDAYNQVFNEKNAQEISAPYDILIDGTDNFAARYLMNDIAVLTGKPYVYGSIFRFEGQVSVFDARCGPCYRCLFADPPQPEYTPPHASIGVFGILPGTIGSIQATETIKLILGTGNSLIGKLLLYDALSMSFQTVQLNKNPACKICSKDAQIHNLQDFPSHYQIPEPEIAITPADYIEPQQLARKIQLQENMLLIDLREPIEQQLSAIPGAKNIPYADLSEKMVSWNPDQKIILIDHSEEQSAWAFQRLKKTGFTHVMVLKGGILAWAQQVDSKQLKY